MNPYIFLILLFSGCSLSASSQLPLRTYHYINVKMNWTDAQSYCRVHFDDLATIENLNDISSVKAGFTYYWAWIGLIDDPNSWKFNMGNESNSWRWSATGETSKTGYHNWRDPQPDNYLAAEFCVIMNCNGTWSDVSCNLAFNFVCYNEQGQNGKVYVFVSQSLPWKSAQDYCRQQHMDLAVIDNSVENAAVYSLTQKATSWIGLYRVQWSWSDKSQSSYRQWSLYCPNNNGGAEFCVSKNNQHQWDDFSCSSTAYFICQQVSKRRTVVRLQMKADAYITDPAINAQILQQVNAVVKGHGWTGFSLRWIIPPSL